MVGRWTMLRRILPVVFVAGLGLGCKGSVPAAARSIEPASPLGATPPAPPGTVPLVPPAGPIVKVGGWKTLVWGDSPEVVKRKLRDERSLTCGRVFQQENQKGRALHAQICRGASKDMSALQSANMLYLDQTLQRIVIVYQMSPYTAQVGNLQSALTARYCALVRPLNSALLEARLGNIGKITLVSVSCRLEGGTIFLSVKSGAHDSTISIYTSSDGFGAFQSENEFKRSF